MGSATRFHADHRAGRQWPSQVRKPTRLNSRRAMIRPVQSATQATKTFFAKSTPTVVLSILTYLPAVKNELQQFNIGTWMPGGKPTGWVGEVLL